jgi:alpha,alpha-trehalase
MKTVLRTLALFLCLCALTFAQTNPDYSDVKQYIAKSWDVLTRSIDNCNTVVDPKMTTQSVLYVPAEYAINERLKQIAEKCKVQVIALPEKITRPGQFDVAQLHGKHGLLLLENPYVVPGGFFNEMYGWDSYFIALGLIDDGHVDVARGMAENFFFEIEHYGAVLNANRSYYLTRSQPPYLSSMVMAIYNGLRNSEHDKSTDDRKWLARAYDYIVRDHAMWTSAPHLAGNTGLSRYFDHGHGPVPEENETRNSYYHEVIGRLIDHPELRGDALVSLAKDQQPEDGPAYSVRVCEGDGGANCDQVTRLAFSSDYYKGDRAMRESGFDISFRFGPYGARTHHFAPVCLNSLLYKTEKDLEQIATILVRPNDATKWRDIALSRQKTMQTLMWDDQRGMFFDYDFDAGKRSTYEFGTTFYPLWSGWASPQQAAALQKNLKVFERPGGMLTSPRENGVQWDSPYGWAPLQLVAVDGLRRYQFNADADRIARAFVGTVAENFRRDGTIREKYNVITRSSETQITAGYQTNVIGFGWTNAVFLEFLRALQQPPHTN